MINKKIIYAAAAWLIFAMLFTEANAQMNGKQENIIHLTIYQNKPGARISDNFPGFSYEAGLLAAEPGFLNAGNKILVQMIRNLGNGILRIGGNSSDITHWTGKARSLNTGKDSLTTTDIDVFTKFAKTTGWKVIFGLNLGDNNVDAAVNEAQYVNKKMKNGIYVYQFGNEPDLYYKWLRPKTYDSSAFLSDWNNYYDKVKESLPGIGFAGPDVSHNIHWVDYFADNNGKKIALLDAHYYRKMGNHTDTRWDYILNTDTALNGYLNNLKEKAAGLNIPYRISECNSVSRGGKADVSDVFASALWGLDFMWTVAAHNGQGINFHGGTDSHYAPIVLKNGKPVARPLYYAMLAFKYGSGNGQTVPVVADETKSNYGAYAAVNGQKTTVTLINKELSDKIFSIAFNQNASNCQAAFLTAPSPTSKSKIQFANSAVKEDGTFQLGELKDYPVQNKKLKIIIPAMSAAVLFVE